MSSIDPFGLYSIPKPVTGPLRSAAVPDLHTAGRRVQWSTWVFLASLFCVLGVFSTGTSGPATEVIVALVAATSGFLWVYSIGRLGAAVAVAAPEAEAEVPAPPPVGDTHHCPACSFLLSGHEVVCPDCGISFVDEEGTRLV